MVPPIPTITFAKNYTLEIGNETLKLDYYGNNHFPGNIFIYAPKQKVLMLVDVIFPGWVPFPYLALAKDTAGFIKAHDIALNNYDFDTLVGGHLTRLGTRNDVIVQRIFIRLGKGSCSGKPTSLIWSDCKAGRWRRRTT